MLGIEVEKFEVIFRKITFIQLQHHESNTVDALNSALCR